MAIAEIIVNQVLFVAAHDAKCITVICDDTDVFVLLMHYYFTEEEMTYKLLMVGTAPSRATVDIKATVENHSDLVMTFWLHMLYQVVTQLPASMASVRAQ